jgi:hypothetical protein
MATGLCTRINFELVCAVCGTPLSADPDKGEIIYNSTYETISKMSIIPCQKCISDIERPVKLIAEGLSLIKGNN